MSKATGTIVIPTKRLGISINIKFSFEEDTSLRVTTPGFECYMSYGDTEIPVSLETVLRVDWGCKTKDILSTEKILLDVLEGRLPVDGFYQISFARNKL